MNLYREIAEKYPNICSIFSEDWFDRELRTNFDKRHLIAKLILNSENIYVSHLEQEIGLLREEINKERKHFNRLLDKSHFQQTQAEIEIGALFKKMGFDIKFEQIIPGSKKSADIKVSNSESEAYIEIRTIKDKEGELIEDYGDVKIESIPFYRPIDYKDKIEKETHGLSKESPGIIALYLEPGIVNYRAIRSAFYDGALYCDTNGNPLFFQIGESAAQNTEISALLLYKHWHTNSECMEHKILYLNPNSSKPLPDKFIALLKEKGFDVERPEKYISEDQLEMLKDSSYNEHKNKK